MLLAIWLLLSFLNQGLNKEYLLLPTIICRGFFFPHRMTDDIVFSKWQNKRDYSDNQVTLDRKEWEIQSYSSTQQYSDFIFSSTGWALSL